MKTHVAIIKSPTIEAIATSINLSLFIKIVIPSAHIIDSMRESKLTDDPRKNPIEKVSMLIRNSPLIKIESLTEKGRLKGFFEGSTCMMMFYPMKCAQSSTRSFFFGSRGL